MRWTFGIPTNGNNDNLHKILKSIIDLNIPQDKFEIILAVEKENKKLPYKQIIVPERNKFWISKKKNDIIKEAKFENICLAHDYIAFAPEWYESYNEFKNWDICGNQVRNLNTTGERISDWIGLTSKGWALIPYHNKTDTMFMSGVYSCVKKQFIINNNLFLDENLLWGEFEDREWSARCLKHTEFSFNRYAINYSVKYKQFHLPEVKLQNTEIITPINKKEMLNIININDKECLYINDTNKDEFRKYQNESINFIHIHIASDLNNIISWYQKVKLGGWICGECSNIHTINEVLRITTQELNLLTIDTPSTWGIHKL